MRRLPMSEARRQFAELVSRAQYANETTVVTKHGKAAAAIVPTSKIAGGLKKKSVPVPRTETTKAAGL